LFTLLNLIILSNKPNPSKFIIIEEPPKLTNGNGTPVTGIKEVAAAIFITA